MTAQLKTANPVALGLAGFGLTTILLSLHNAGFYELNVMIMSMGIFYGGFAQIIAGLMEWQRGNSFGSFVFISYGFFWLVLVFIWIGTSLGLPAASPTSMGWFMTGWGIFTLFMFFSVLQGKLIGKLIFSTLIVVFSLLAMANFMDSKLLHTMAGYVGICCGSCAFYEAVATVVNEKYGKDILPM